MLRKKAAFRSWTHTADKTKLARVLDPPLDDAVCAATCTPGTYWKPQGVLYLGMCSKGKHGEACLTRRYVRVFLNVHDAFDGWSVPSSAVPRSGLFRPCVDMFALVSEPIELVRVCGDATSSQTIYWEFHKRNVAGGTRASTVNMFYFESTTCMELIE